MRLKTMNSNKYYSELIRLTRFIDRYRYLKLNGKVGDETFGYDRYLNQILYQSSEWRRFRRNIVIWELRDMKFKVRF